MRLPPILFAFLFLLAPAARAEDIVKQFEQSFNAALKEAGKDYGACRFEEIGKGPDGEGGEATAVGVACERAPFICVFLVRQAKDGSGPEMRPVDCRPNPAYDDTPKQSI